MKRFLLPLLLPLLLAQTTAPSTQPATLHPALFLVGDSTMNTGRPPGDTGPWGYGHELPQYFDLDKIHVYNEGKGGRSSRGYIEEGAWKSVLARLQPGDVILLQFGHNDARNSANYPDRVSANGNSDDLADVDAPAGKKPVHSYGYYLRQFAADAKAKGAHLIILSPVPRNQWADGKIKRGFDGYAQWAKEAAAQVHVPFIDLNSIAADAYDALGQTAARDYFNDTQHTTKKGAKLNAQALISALHQLKGSPLAPALRPLPPAIGPATQPFK